MDGTKAQLIHHGEVIERNLDSKPVEKKKTSLRARKQNLLSQTPQRKRAALQPMCVQFMAPIGLITLRIASP